MSRYCFYNPNPEHQLVEDCTIRAISKLMNQDWDKTYLDICAQGFFMKNMPSTNIVWGAYLMSRGYETYIIPNSYYEKYTVEDFCYDHPKGRYLLALDGHVVAVVDGFYYDSWDSGNEIPLFYWRKEY